MYTLYIDESGDINLRTIDPERPHFSLSAVIVKDTDKEPLRERAQQIKFKYWGKTTIVFHVVDLISLRGVFRRFAPVCKPKLPITDFYKDFTNLIRELTFQIGFVCVNKTAYISKNPSLKGMLDKLVELKNTGNNSDYFDLQREFFALERNIVIDHATKIFVMYLFLLKKETTTGRVVIESTGGAQDLSIFAAYNDLLSHGYLGFKMDGIDVRKYFTSISFVTKNNHDTETQIADAVASFLNIGERQNDGVVKKKMPPEHQEVIDAIKVKSFEYKDTDFGTPKNSIQREC